MTNLFEAADARDRALAQVQSNAGDFGARALAALAAFPSGFEATGEKIRNLIERQGIRPHHPNAWGAVINTAVRRGLLTWTGRMGQMTALKSHARKTPIYRVTT